MRVLQCEQELGPHGLVPSCLLRCESPASRLDSSTGVHRSASELAGWWGWAPADRIWLAAVPSLIPRHRWSNVFPITPGTLLAWHRQADRQQVGLLRPPGPQRSTADSHRALAQPPGGLVAHLPQSRPRRPVLRRPRRDRTRHPPRNRPAQRPSETLDLFRSTRSSASYAVSRRSRTAGMDSRVRAARYSSDAIMMSASRSPPTAMGSTAQLQR